MTAAKASEGHGQAPTMLSRLIRQGGAYALAGALLKGAGLILAPLLLNDAYLAVEDYGSLALLMVTAQLAVLVTGMGLSTALLRFMTAEKETDRALPATALVLSLGASVTAALLLVGFSGPLAAGLTDDPSNSGLLIPLAGYVASKCLAAIPLTLLRVREQAGRYTAAVVLEMAALILLAYWELAVGGTGLPGLLRAYALSAVVSLVALLGLTMRTVSWRFRPSLVGPLLRFGLPLIVASLAGWFLNAGDRYILKWLADREAVAAYEWSARLAGLINMLLVQSFQLAFTVVGLKALRDGADRFYAQTLRHFSVWTGAAVLLLSVWTPDGMRLLMLLFDVDPAYMEAGTLVFPLALGFGAYGIYIIVNNALLSSGRTGVISANVLFVAVLNAGLNVALIPRFGALGAAVATTLSYAVLAGIAAWTTRRELSVAYPWKIPVQVTVLLILLFWVGTLAEGLAPGARFLAKAGISLTYLAAIPIAKFYQPWEIRHGLTRAQAFLRGKSSKLPPSAGHSTSD